MKSLLKLICLVLVLSFCALGVSYAYENTPPKGALYNSGALEDSSG